MATKIPDAPKIGMVSLGCPKNLVDSERILTKLRSDGYQMSADYDGADVVLVTDGEGLGPAAFDEVAALRADGAFVSAIHVAPSQRPGDMPPPDPAGLERLAAAGGGFFADATAPLAVADGIGRGRSDALAEGDYAVLHYTDYGRYLLVLALFPALALFRRSV